MADPEAPTPLSEARENAKLGLAQAIEELQKSAGPDQRVTVRADILGDEIARPLLTGVWKSWEIDALNPPDSNDYNKDSKFPKFVSWLVSNPDLAATKQVGFADLPVSSPVTLLGSGSLGSGSPLSEHVTASKVPAPSAMGAFAWAVLDEGVKARINTPYVSDADSIGGQTMQLGTGVRPGTEWLPGLAGLDREKFEASSQEFADLTSGIGTDNFGVTAEQISPGVAEALKPLAHDVSLHSVGLFTDTAHGGLKEDFSLLSDGANLPAKYASRGVYESCLGVDVPSDPSWESLWDFATIHRDRSKLVSYRGQPVVMASVPAGWRASVGSSATTGERGVANLEPPPGVVLMPVIERVQMFFSLMSRDIYSYPKISDTTPKVPGTASQEEASSILGPWGRNYAGTAYDYVMNLVYTPIVTVRNPYNVTLEFRDLKVVFGNVPFAMQIIRNGVAQTTGLAPLDTLYYQNAERGQVPKRFGMSLRTNSGITGSPQVGSSTVRLLPGEVMIFTPYGDPNSTYTNNGFFADWPSNSNKTMSISGIPGWRGDGFGFYADWLCPVGQRVSSNEVEGAKLMNRGGTIAARAVDEFSVKFAPLSVVGLSNNKFVIEMFARTDGGQQVSSGVIEMDYGAPTGLQDTLLGDDGSITFPSVGTINTMAMHVHSTTKLKEVYTVRPFAMVNVHAKTTHGGDYADSVDGRLAAMPSSFAHSSIGASSAKLSPMGFQNTSHEFDFRRLDNGINGALYFDLAGRGAGVTGQNGFTGISFGAQYEIPIAPIQSLAGLNGANPGGSSGYLPRFAQPIGNSWAHPMLDPEEVITAGSEYPLADHSFLMNLALYDRFYFSGLAGQTGAFGSGERSADLAMAFSNGGYLDDPRLMLYRPKGRKASEFASEVAKNDAYADVAAWQMMKGAFNVNSTSVAAWKAMLASVHDSDTLFSSIDKDTGMSSFDSLPDHQYEARISRFRLPAELGSNGVSMEDYWLGAREYSGEELQVLAENIVEQVRERGPFLSMAEFVNRRLGSDELAQSGALQAAIDESDLNEDYAIEHNAGYEIPASAVADLGYVNPAAAVGPSYQGAPGYLTQADLLNVLGNAATVRSDTFTIRCYGEKTDGVGAITAKAVGEAVVQRLPDWYDPTESPTVHPDDLQVEANRTLGRGFRIIAFRWLSDEEI